MDSTSNQVKSQLVLRPQSNVSKALADKFRSKGQLLEYMKMKCILSGTKEAFETKEITNLNIKDSWHELAVKNVWPQLKHDKEVRKYLPANEMDLGKFPDKKFFWGVISTVRQDWCQKFKDDVMKNREKLVLNFNKKIIVVTDKWKQKLEEFDFAPKGFKRGAQSVLIEAPPKKVSKKKTRLQYEGFGSQIDQQSSHVNELQMSFNQPQNETFKAPLNPFAIQPYGSMYVITNEKGKKMKVDAQYVKELGLSDNEVSIIMTPKKERRDSDVSFDILNKTNEKKFDTGIKAQGFVSVKSDKKEKKNKQEK